jgi:hypothetical protein
MTCQAARERIIEASSGLALSPETAAHLRECSACAEVQHGQQLLWQRLDAWEAPAISSDFEERLFRRLEGRTSAARSNWLAGWFRPVQPAFAAALVCLVVAAGLVIEQAQQVSSEQAAAVQGWEREDLRQIDTALDDIEMLSEFEILPVGPAGEGRS